MIESAIHLRADTPSGLMPEALGVLAGSLLGPLFHHRQGLRHPHGAYNVSLYPLLDAFIEVFDLIHGITLRRPFATTHNTVWDYDLLRAQLALLRSLEEHFELSERILRGFLPPRGRVGKHPAIMQYRSAVHPLRDRVAKIVNLIKHSQGSLAGYHVYNDQIAYLGYFAQAVDDKGFLGPAPHIHAGGNTAFSFDRDLRLHFASVYIVSRHLAAAIRSVVGTDAGSPNIKGDVVELPRSVAESIAALPTVLFPDELTLPFPSIRVSTTPQGVQALSIRYPDADCVPTPVPSGMRSVSFHYTDGVTFKWRTPYAPPTDLTKRDA